MGPAPEVAWRPTAESMRNLVVLWGAVGLAATTSAALTGTSTPSLAVVLGLAAAGGWIVGAAWSTPRIRTALAEAKKVRPANWPPTATVRAAMAHAGRRNALVGTVVGALAGTALGAIPVFGAGVAASGVAGTIGTLMLWRTVHAFEAANDALVLTAQTTRTTPKRTLELGLVSR